eukprot:9719602-Alexandrium_andersonii.AAC.1
MGAPSTKASTQSRRMVPRPRKRSVTAWAAFPAARPRTTARPTGPEREEACVAVGLSTGTSSSSAHARM